METKKMTWFTKILNETIETVDKSIDKSIEKSKHVVEIANAIKALAMSVTTLAQTVSSLSKIALEHDDAIRYIIQLQGQLAEQLVRGPAPKEGGLDMKMPDLNKDSKSQKPN